MTGAGSTQPLAVAGVFYRRSAAMKAIDKLLQSGVDREKVSVILPESYAGDEPEEYGVRETGAGDLGQMEPGSAAPLGGAVSLMAGLGLFAIPGLGPLLAVGPFAAGLAPGAAGGTAGALADLLIGLGIAEDEAGRYGDLLRRNRILVIMSCDDKRICDDYQAKLEAFGAEEVSGHHFPASGISDDLLFY